MAYSAKYKAKWTATDGKTGWLYIDQNNYDDDIISIRLVSDAITLSNDFSDWESHLIGMTCEFSVINDKSNFFTLSDLMIAKEYRYRVRVVQISPTTLTLFSGFINTEACTQKYLIKQVITLVASTFTSKLENVHPSIFNEARTATFIDVIIEILKQSRSATSIKVGNNFVFQPTTYFFPALTKTYLNITGLYTELFWRNNVERENSKDILVGILTSFNAYMYYFEDCWWIERYSELGVIGTKFFVEYSAGAYYSPDSIGVFFSTVTEQKSLHDFVFIEMSQEITVNPGKRQISIKIEDKEFYNLTQNIFRPLTRISSDPAAPNEVRPPLGKWYAWQPPAQTSMVWNDEGNSYLTMVNSVRRTVVGLAPAPNVGVPEGLWDTYAYRYAGLITSFEFTYVQGNNLSLSWLFAFPQSRPLDNMHGFTFNWTLDIYRNGVFIGVLIYDSSDKLWRLGNATELTKTFVDLSEFDKDNICEVSISIPLDDVKDYVQPLNKFKEDNYSARLKIMTESLKYAYRQGLKWKTAPLVLMEVWYGDITIKVGKSDEYLNNLIEGTVNDDFLEKQEVSIVLADMPNYNYKNAILAGSDLKVITTEWNIGASTMPLVDYLMKDLFRIGNTSRQVIKGTVKSEILLRPFTIYKDHLQDKLFMLTKLRHNVTDDIYEVQLDEYDNTSEINLIES